MGTSNILFAITFLLLLISPSFAEEKILIEGKGFRDLIIGEHNVDDVIQSLGKPDTIEETPKEWSRNYIYSKLGLKINFHYGKLNTISTLPNFDGKTLKGITLNSSLEELEATYGEPVVAPNKTKNNANAWSYDEGVIFWLKRSRLLKRFEGIETIVVYNNSLRLKEKMK